MVLIAIDFTTMIKNTQVIPSPYGDYGSYLSRKDILRVFRQAWFPSPYGDYGSYLYEQEAADCESFDEVSVPLRGLWFLSPMAYLSNRINLYRFRPLTGIMVLINSQ